MPRRSSSDKRWRMLQFLLGTGEPDVATALKEHGFSERHLEEGWRLLRATEKDCFAPDEAPAARLTVAELDAWENRWFPVVRACLTRHHPEACDYLFENLRQTRGFKVHVSVGELIARIRKLETEGPVEGAREARALLAERGLTDQALTDIESRIDGRWQLDERSEGELDARARRQEAEARMWSWHLEWSAVVRALVRRPASLRKLGFRGPPGRKTTPDRLDEETTSSVELN